MRGQLSVEMFIAVTLALIFFGWMANFVNAFQSSQLSTSVYSQEKAVASTLARLANAACTTNVSIQVALPCISAGSQPIQAYTVNTTATGRPAVTVVAEGANVSQASSEALCNVTGAFSAQCSGHDAGQACAWRFNGAIRISPGACP